MNEQKCLFKKEKKHKIWSKLTLDNYLTDQGDESEKSKKQKKEKKKGPPRLVVLEEREAD